MSNPEHHGQITKTEIFLLASSRCCPARGGFFGDRARKNVFGHADGGKPFQKPLTEASPLSGRSDTTSKFFGYKKGMKDTTVPSCRTGVIAMNAMKACQTRGHVM
ncbi:MAG: hypothetical protein J6A79_04630 [Clostridia bacterium]|nr:hypothetical protein [Clostridia bacterium]